MARRTRGNLKSALAGRTECRRQARRRLQPCRRCRWPAPVLPGCQSACPRAEHAHSPSRKAERPGRARLGRSSRGPPARSTRGAVQRPSARPVSCSASKSLAKRMSISGSTGPTTAGKRSDRAPMQSTEVRRPTAAKRKGVRRRARSLSALKGPSPTAGSGRRSR